MSPCEFNRTRGQQSEKHNHHIIGCHVAVIRPSHKHLHGNGYSVHISLTVPPHENVIVNHVPSDDSRYGRVEVAVEKDTFASARRQLDDLAQQN